MKGTLLTALGFFGDVALLGYYAYPRSSCCYGPKVRTKALLADVVSAVRAYQLEYNRLPTGSEIEEDWEVVFDGSSEAKAVLGVLMGGIYQSGRGNLRTLGRSFLSSWKFRMVRP